ncbi:hypothetical protein Tco_0886824 [Tanacetum coccineum]
MTTLAEHIIVAGAENRPPMLEKSMYDSWESRIRLFIKGKKHGRMMLDSIANGPLVYPTVKENGQARPMNYSELTKAQQLQDKCDVQATNIILHGLPPDQVQVNTKFLNALPPEWSKFVTNVKLAKSLYTTNYDQLYAYLSQHKRYANEVPPIHHQHHHTPVNPQQQSVSPQPFISSPVTQQSQAEFPQLDSGLAVPTFQFPPSNNELKTSSNPRNPATIQDERVTVQQVQGRQTQSFAGTGNRGIATTSRGKYAAGQAKEKLMLAEAQEAGQILDEEQLAFIADPGIAEVQDVQEMSYSEQTDIVDFPDNKITNDSNIILYS